LAASRSEPSRRAPGRWASKAERPGRGECRYLASVSQREANCGVTRVPGGGPTPSWAADDPSLELTATARPKFPDPSIPSDVTRCCSKSSTRPANPVSVFCTSSLPGVGRCRRRRPQPGCLCGFDPSDHAAFPLNKCDRGDGDAQAPWGPPDHASPRLYAYLGRPLRPPPSPGGSQ